MARTRMFLKSALLALFATVAAGNAVTPNASVPDPEPKACYPGCTQSACDKSCGGPGTGVCSMCRCYCLL